MSDEGQEVGRWGSSPHGRAAIRVLSPAGVIVLAGIIGARLADPDRKPFFDNLHWTVSYAAAAILAWIGVRLAPGRNLVKRWCAIGLSCYAIGQVLWDIQVWTNNNPFPGPSDAFYILLPPAYAFGFIAYLLQRKVSMSTASLDIVGLSLAFLSLTLAIYVPRQQDHSLFHMIVLVAYPVGYFAATASCLVTVLKVQARPHPGWIITLAGLSVNTLLWLRWNVATLDNELTDGSWFNAMFSVTAIALGMGALVLRGLPSDASARWARFCSAVLRILPLFTVAACAIGVIIASVTPSLREYRIAVLPGFVVAVILAAVRQSISLTERESLLQTERQLLEAEGRSQLIIDTALDAVISMGSDGRISQWNPVAEQMFGYSREEALGAPLAELIVPTGMRGAHQRGLSAYLETGKPKIVGKTVEIDAMRKGGEIFPIEISVKAIQTPQGPFFSAFIRDLTQRRADEEARRNLEAELRQSQKMEAVGTLAAGIAHDFNNILAAIRGNADLAAEDLPTDHPARQSVDEIRRAGLRAAQLVQQIVAFSRKDRSTNMTPVNVAEIAYEVTRLLRSTLPPNVEITVIAESGLRLVMADPSQIHQVLVNLYTNAWQAMEGRGGRIDVRLSNQNSPEEDPRVCLAVIDNGMGMPPERAERIFEPFFTTKRMGEGTGLGLSVVHNIVANHGGYIEVQSSEGVGTEIRVLLPALIAADSAQMTMEMESEAPKRSANIAYVDDEEALLMLVRRSLSRKGHNVTGYLSATDAIGAIRTEPGRFDIVITDLNMPELSGLDLAQELRRSLPDLPILLTSGFVSDQILADAEAAGITRVIEKPSSLDDLCSAIQEILQDGSDQRMLK